MAYEVFISSSHQDQALRKELDTHLANLKRQDIITSWYDGDIKPGEELQPQIIEHLNYVLPIGKERRSPNSRCCPPMRKRSRNGLHSTKAL